MFHLRGSIAVSHFRIERLLTQIGYIVPQVSGLYAEFVHFIDHKFEITPAEKNILSQLLNYGQFSKLSEPFEIGSRLILVVPRLGTISSWSSRATEIAHQSGLSQINRIERGVAYYIETNDKMTWGDQLVIAGLLHDRMTESVLYDFADGQLLFRSHEKKPLKVIDILKEGKNALIKANYILGLALSNTEIEHFLESFIQLQRNPTEAEFMMFAHINSEAYQHKVFNAQWLIEGEFKPQSLFSMIKNTYEMNSRGVLSAYKDNGAIIEGGDGVRLFPDPKTHVYTPHTETIYIVMKVDTCNYSTAISPGLGSATGVGGEIRNESAVGRGVTPIAALTGLSVSNLHIPNFTQSWERICEKPHYTASALEIILEAPIGMARFNNEFGRPNLCGYFRTYEQSIYGREGWEVRGYHKPIVITGGFGHIRKMHIQKKELLSGMPLIVLGGSAFLMGLGEEVFVLRDNAEMQRRCQSVIDACLALGIDDPIASIQAVGFGGLANAALTLLQESGKGGRFNLQAIPAADPNLSPLELWCYEVEEQFVLAIQKTQLEQFIILAKRENCPFSIVGEVTEEAQLRLEDTEVHRFLVDMPLPLLGKLPRLRRETSHFNYSLSPLETIEVDLQEIALRLLQLPVIADKSFLITITDRTATGLVVRDQMVGPWQVPVADCAVTVRSFDGYQGEAMAMGERSPLSLINPAASARMAIAEAITNIAAANIGTLSDVRLSLNWMAACDYGDEDVRLHDAVQSVGLEFCPALGLTVPIVEESLSMQTTWFEENEQKKVIAPLSLVVSAFAPVMDVCNSLTPELRLDVGETELLFIDLSGGLQRLGGSSLAQVLNQVGNSTPDVDHPKQLKDFFAAIQQLNLEEKLLAYHDRSEGGLFVTLCEMAFASHVGLLIDISELGADPVAILFNEELGAVIQVQAGEGQIILAELADHGLTHCYSIGTIDRSDTLSFIFNEEVVLSSPRITLQRTWSLTSYHLQALRDNPRCALKQYNMLLDKEDPGLQSYLTYDISEDITAPYLNLGVFPKIAILREQGSSGYLEMAAAFHRAGFSAVDVQMNDLVAQRILLSDFKGLVACGGFSFGDVLGAGLGWAKRVLLNPAISECFQTFFARSDTFTLGVGNGCQFLSGIKTLIPGAEKWPSFLKNYSEQFESRLCLVEVEASPSIFFQGMAGSLIPVPIAHSEGRVEFLNDDIQQQVLKEHLITLRYVDTHGRKTRVYPANPNGSPLGITGLTTPDGRATILMPHPERGFRSVQLSWHPKEWGEEGPWLRFFRNARTWVG